MLKSRRLIPRGRFDHRLAVSVVAAAVLAAFVPSVPSAQQKPLHLNPVIEKLIEGKPVFYYGTDDFSLTNARQVARSGFDYVIAEQEHSPMDLLGLNHFLLAMVDKSAILKKGNLQWNTAVFGRFPSGFGAAGFFAQQALDMGMMGMYFPLTGTKEQALNFVQIMRYGQKRGSKIMEPVGLRGKCCAPWSWGVTMEEYERRADVWPLNPEGDLLAVMMIESAEGLKNVDAIASVPGVGGLTATAGVDLSNSMGISPDSPEIEAAFQTILKACKAHNVACSTASNTNTGEGIVKRFREGWSIVRTTPAARADALRLLGQQ